MRVGMDISQLAHKGGVGVYTKNLSEELSKHKELDMVYFYSSLRQNYRGGLKNVKRFPLPPTFFEPFFNKWRILSIEQFIGEIDIFHSSDWIQPPTKAKKVTTYHDVIPLKYPNWSHPKIINVHKRRLKVVEGEIDHVIAVSEATKEDLLKISSIPEEKITVIYEGPSFDFKRKSAEEIKRFKEKYKLPEKFVLAIGGIGERKNLERIKEACKGYNLVITGESIPWLKQDELNLLYCSADILVYASLYEGFGLPIVDAFYCGLPVITSNISSMPEVGGDAVVYVDPQKVEDIKQKLDSLTNDSSLKENLIKKGLERAKKFTWEKTADQTAKLYKSLYK